MPLQVALAVAVDVEAAHHPAALDGVLPDPRMNAASLPLDIPWQADVDRQQPTGRGEGHSGGLVGAVSLLASAGAIRSPHPSSRPSRSQGRSSAPPAASLRAMFDHVGIAASDLAASERFYRTVLSALGVEPSHADAELVEWDDWAIGSDRPRALR